MSSGFSKKVKEELFFKNGRCCAICKKLCGTNIEAHHIEMKKNGGKNTIENAISLCFDCHAEAGFSNKDHPKGNMYGEGELKKHKLYWENFCMKNPGKISCANLERKENVIDNFLVEIELNKRMINSCLQREKDRPASKSNLMGKCVDRCFDKLLAAGLLNILPEIIRINILDTYNLFRRINSLCETLSGESRKGPVNDDIRITMNEAAEMAGVLVEEINNWWSLRESNP
ncbi:HNH endonuclease [Patescibacteria group bacterium]|nr:HNH endonuclease [Patescibacteria group bacterium]